jgi:hypothetical protein
LVGSHAAVSEKMGTLSRQNPPCHGGAVRLHPIRNGIRFRERTKHDSPLAYPMKAGRRQITDICKLDDCRPPSCAMLPSDVFTLVAVTNLLRSTTRAAWSPCAPGPLYHM